MGYIKALEEVFSILNIDINDFEEKQFKCFLHDTDTYFIKPVSVLERDYIRDLSLSSDIEMLCYMGRFTIKNSNVENFLEHMIDLNQTTNLGDSLSKKRNATAEEKEEYQQGIIFLKKIFGI